MAAQKRGADEAHDDARDGYEEHLEPAHLVGVAQHPDAGDGEGQAARHHGAGAHHGVRDVRLVEAGLAVPEGLEEEQRDDGREHDGPRKRPHLEGRVHRCRGDDGATDAAYDDAAQRQLPFDRIHSLLLCVYPLPLTF